MPEYIYINGLPGIGKSAIAHELQKLLPNAKVFPAFIFTETFNLLLKRYGRTSPRYQVACQVIRRYILDRVVNGRKTQHVTWIFTDSRGCSIDDIRAALDYMKAAGKRGVPFVPVIMKCSPEEHMKRAAGEGKDGYEDMEMSTQDWALLSDMRKSGEIFSFGGSREVKMDITKLTAVQAAQRIRLSLQIAQENLAPVV